MRTIHIEGHFKAFVGTILMMGFAASPLFCQVQYPRPVDEIRLEHLQKVGFHLPPYMPTILDLIKYQNESLPTHQQLTVEWDSLNGREKMLRKEEADAMPLSYNFNLLERKHNLPGPPGRKVLELDGYSLVIVGVTAKNEVRGLAVQNDQRVTHGESMLPGEQHSEFFVAPKVVLKVSLPDDPQIQRIVFLKPRRVEETWQLERLATIEVTAK